MTLIGFGLLLGIGGLFWRSSKLCWRTAGPPTRFNEMRTSLWRHQSVAA
jgi:hypothetical protein